MAYDHKGTKITGTSGTPKKFPKSGVKKAKKNDTYFNTKEGHVYKCDTAGGPSDAKWVYVRTDIASKPSKAVKGLGAPKRVTVGSGTRYMKAEWKVPKNLTDEKRGDRATGLYVDWWLGISGKDPKRVTKTGNERLESQQINLNNLTIGSKTYTRESFYPFSGKPKLGYVTVGVIPFNSEGKGPVAKAKIEFELPKEPKISAPAFNSGTGEVTCTITTDSGTGKRERYDTYYKVIVVDSRLTGKNRKKVVQEGHSTDTSIPISYDASGYQSLGYKDYVSVTIEAWARGFKGNSQTASETYYVSYPAKASFDGEPRIDSRDSTGRCIVPLKTNDSTSHPVDQIRLEYMTNVEYETAGDIPGDASWESSEIVDDAQCTALSIGVSEILPERGKYTWIRLKTWHASETVLYRYSSYKRLKKLEVAAATAEDDTIDIISAVPGKDGKSIVVQLGWNADGEDDATGTELSWAEEEDTWRSTEEPDSFEFEWSDGPYPASGQAEYQDSALITIKGLEEGTSYYIRARRYLEGDATTYSPYTDPEICMTNETPESVVADCERYVPTGSSLQVDWTLSGNGTQTAWRIIAESGAVIAEGEGSIGSTQIGAERLASFAENGNVIFTVQASAGSGFIVSDEKTVTILDPPVLTLSADQQLSEQPLTFQVSVSAPSNLIVIVTSQGVSGQFPEGLLRQTKGDTIYSGVLTPEWTEESESWSTEVQLPDGLDFWDLGGYTLTVTAVDQGTGLQSEAAEHDFAIGWQKKAQDPADAVTLTPIEETDETGNHHQAVEITLMPPENASETDVYDIYRLTADGARLIGEGFPLTFTARDEFAPFGDAMTHHYRIAVRTVDGDVNFADIEYVAEGSCLRFDWAEGSLELPYNISVADRYKKDVEIRKHMDGETAGYWNQGVERTASLSSDVIRLDSQADIDMARNLARYPGAVFVRTPDGSAYEADVQVTDMSTEGIIVAIAIDASEIGLTQEFILPSPFSMEEE